MTDIIKIPYRGYVIECDDEFGYILTNGVRDLGEFGTMKEAKETVDQMIRDSREFQYGAPCD